MHQPPTASRFPAANVDQNGRIYRQLTSAPAPHPHRRPSILVAYRVLSRRFSSESQHTSARFFVATAAISTNFPHRVRVYTYSYISLATRTPRTQTHTPVFAGSRGGGRLEFLGGTRTSTLALFTYSYEEWKEKNGGWCGWRERKRRQWRRRRRPRRCTRRVEPNFFLLHPFHRGGNPRVHFSSAPWHGGRKGCGRKWLVIYL